MRFATVFEMQDRRAAALQRCEEARDLLRVIRDRFRLSDEIRARIEDVLAFESDEI
jgi:hypothetical protein